MTHATSGPMLPEPLAVYDPDSSCWRTFGGMFPSDSMPSLATFPPSGMTRGGELFELPTPGHHMDEPASSSAPGLLPTPTSQAAKHAYDDRGPGTLDDHNLWAVAPRLLATPRTTDANGAGSHGTGGMDLRTQVSLLPTPAVNDMGAGKTPEAWDEWTGRMQAAHGNGNGHGKSLAIEALRLAEED